MAGVPSTGSLRARRLVCVLPDTLRLLLKGVVTRADASGLVGSGSTDTERDDTAAKVEFAEGKRSFPHRPVTAPRRPAEVPGIDPWPIGDIRHAARYLACNK